MFDFNKYQRENRPGRYVQKIKCADGFNMSVQCSDGHYCNPREDNVETYMEVEVGFPSVKEETLMPYMENLNDDPTRNVYAWVPVEIVNAIVDAHGGLKVNA